MYLRPAVFHNVVRVSGKRGVCGRLCEETLWLLGKQGLAEFDRAASEDLELKSTVLHDAGLYLMASTKGRSQLLIDSGGQGGLTAGHGHADALSVTVQRDGRPLLIDSGTFAYVDVGSERDFFRGTRAHNTMTVDDTDQADPKGPFSWGRLPKVQVERWITGKSFDLFAGNHDGYGRFAQPVIHRRWVFSLKSRFYFIRDMAIGEGTHHLDLAWHFRPCLSKDQPAGTTFLDADGNGLTVIPLNDEKWSHDLREEHWSPAYGRSERLQVLHSRGTVSLPTEVATVLVPTAGNKAFSGRLTRIGASVGPSIQHAYSFETPEETHRFFFSDGMGAWEAGRWSSDADFLYRGGSDADSRTLICANASYVRFSGREVLSSARPVSHCEAVCVGNQFEVLPTDGDVRIGRECLGSISQESESESRVIHLVETENAEKPL